MVTDCSIILTDKSLSKHLGRWYMIDANFELGSEISEMERICNQLKREGATFEEAKHFCEQSIATLKDIGFEEHPNVHSGRKTSSYIHFFEQALNFIEAHPKNGFRFYCEDEDDYYEIPEYEYRSNFKGCN